MDSAEGVWCRFHGNTGTAYGTRVAATDLAILRFAPHSVDYRYRGVLPDGATWSFNGNVWDTHTQIEVRPGLCVHVCVAVCVCECVDVTIYGVRCCDSKSCLPWHHWRCTSQPKHSSTLCPTHGAVPSCTASYACSAPRHCARTSCGAVCCPSELVHASMPAFRTPTVPPARAAHGGSVMGRQSLPHHVRVGRMPA